MSNKNESNQTDGRYEFRVWGDHRKAEKKLADMATTELREEFEDCYLLVDDDEVNAKVRDSTLKVKQLVSTDKGFDQWSSDWHTDADSAPSPLDEVFEELSLDRPQRGKSYSINKAVKDLDDDATARPVFVVKNRRRYRIGSMKAEVTEINVKGRNKSLRTVAIEGDNLKDLVALRRELGLKGEANVPMHVALDRQAS